MTTAGAPTRAVSAVGAAVSLQVAITLPVFLVPTLAPYLERGSA